MNPVNHVAIIMDGNGRWGLKYKNSRNAGHKEGLNTIEKIIKVSIKHNIKFLTLYAFSTENWKRPKKEINYLFNLLENFLQNKIDDLNKQNIKLKFIGNKNFSNQLNKLLKSAEKKTLNNNKLQISSSLVPQKSIQYFESRYLAHPIYNYKLFGVEESNKIIGVIVLRKVFNGSNSALRVVDFLGEPLALNGLYSNFQKLLNDNGSEYIDCYNYGIDESRFYNAGFTKRTKEDDVIIPNYYEPFEKRNVDLHFAFKCDSNYNFVAFKGDSDQDRPNLLGVEQ